MRVVTGWVCTVKLAVKSICGSWYAVVIRKVIANKANGKLICEQFAQYVQYTNRRHNRWMSQLCIDKISTEMNACALFISSLLSVPIIFCVILHTIIKYSLVARTSLSNTKQLHRTRFHHQGSAKSVWSKYLPMTQMIRFRPFIIWVSSSLPFNTRCSAHLRQRSRNNEMIVGKRGFSKQVSKAYIHLQISLTG